MRKNVLQAVSILIFDSIRFPGKHYWLLFVGLLSCCPLLNAQQRIFRIYNTQAAQADLASKDPAYENNLSLLENAVWQFDPRSDKGVVIDLPVIFHVLTTDGEQPVSNAQIEAQLKILNHYFGTYEPDQHEAPNEDVTKYRASGANPRINFYLPEANATVQPVHYKVTSRKSWGISNKVQDPSQQGIAPFDPGHFINVYVAQLDSSYAGYAHLPLTSEAFDGIVIDRDFFSSDPRPGFEFYREGKTLVHLMGVYLGLHELWNDKEPCRDDRVEDTPTHDSPTLTVSTKPNTRRVSFCPGTPTTMYMNFMDNTDDAQLSLFTKGQVARMRAVLLSKTLNRNGLIRK